MTFGCLKTTIESNLINSYKNEKDFKKTLREFKENVLKNKQLSQLYSLYEQLSTPQGLNESDAEYFLEEGIYLINQILPSVRMPKSSEKSKENGYADIDNLVYTTKSNLKERIESKKRILQTLKTETKQIKESVKIPVSSMVKIANQTLETYLESLDSESKKLFIDVIQKDKSELQNNYQSLKENTLQKLSSILSEQKDDELKNKLSDTIEKLQQEEFTQINYVKLINLENGL